MNSKIIIISIAILSIISCSKNEKTVQKNQDVISNATTDKIEFLSVIKDDKPIKDSQFVDAFTQKISVLISENKFVPFDALQSQKLNNIEENSEVIVSSETPLKMSENELYFYLKERTMVVGRPYNGPYEGIVLSLASAYVIHEDGVIITNYHVIEVVEKMKSKAIFVSDAVGNVYPITDILSSSQTNDLAILKIDTAGKKLKTIPFAAEEVIGESIYMMGHPFDNFYYMENGIIARKYISERDDAIKIAITAEFGQGASGGPVVNKNGQLIGMVSGTMVYYTNRSREYGDLQMIVKEVVPVSVINDYIKRE